MTTFVTPAIWHFEYLPYTMLDPNDVTVEREIPSFRIFPEDEPENYIAETNEHLPGDVQEQHARLISAAPQSLDALLDIKRLAEKCGDHEADPFALLDLIADKARAAINKATKT
jgi:hypothetical protein